MNGPTPANELATWVRNWVHYDNLSSNLNKQANNSRKLRDEFETKIIQHLQSQNMENAVIQVSNAKLQVCQEKTCPSLTLARLEEYLHQYYQRKGQLHDETEQIMRFIKNQKQANYELQTRLKKTPLGPVPPGPPPQLR